VLSDLSVTGVNLLGVILLSGFLTQLVGETEHGRPHATLGGILGSLAWGRLIRADLLVWLLVGIGLIALLIPGLIALTLFAVIGPVVETEHRRCWPPCAGPPAWPGRTSGGCSCW
jgi:drug/metabolite transporter superfamily protein YnfA